MAKKKLRIGWFSFSCCEDSTMVWIEMMNDNFFKWKGLLDVRHATVLKKKNSMTGMDVAFVEGAITNDKDAKKLEKIRKNCRKLVAIGSCAINAMPSGQRNTFDPQLKAEIQFLIERFKQAETVRKVSEVVKVDDQIFGCPMDEAPFLAALDKYLKEFGVIDA
jgi:NAD-reducing hydrogenase small subunit